MTYSGTTPSPCHFEERRARRARSDEKSLKRSDSQVKSLGKGFLSIHPPRGDSQAIETTNRNTPASGRDLKEGSKAAHLQTKRQKEAIDGLHR